MGDVRLAKTPSRWARYLTTGFEQRGSSRATDLSRCLCHRAYVILVEAGSVCVCVCVCVVCVCVEGCVFVSVSVSVFVF